MTTKMTATEMYDELIRLGHVVPATVEPSGVMGLYAYVSVPSSTAYVTPPVPGGGTGATSKDAKLGVRTPRNRKGKRRSGR
jgi:hypothetical protein